MRPSGAAAACIIGAWVGAFVGVWLPTAGLAWNIDEDGAARGYTVLLVPTRHGHVCTAPVPWFGRLYGGRWPRSGVIATGAAFEAAIEHDWRRRRLH
jgi:hypothetical protein